MHKLYEAKAKELVSAIGKLMEEMFLSFLAELERKKIKPRKKTQQKSIVIGRPQVSLKTLSKNQLKLLEKNYPAWKNKAITEVAFMHLLALKKNSFYKVIKQFEAKNKNNRRGGETVNALGAPGKRYGVKLR